MIYSVKGSPAQSQYRGCGKAWVATNKNAEIVGIRYMHDFEPDLTKLPKDAKTQIVETESNQFGEYRLKCRRELAELGEVSSGMLSCYEFIPKHW